MNYSYIISKIYHKKYNQQISNIIMLPRLYIYFQLVLLLVLVAPQKLSSGETSEYYFSEKGLSGENQVHAALQIFTPKLKQKLRDIKLFRNGISYNAYNFTTNITYISKDEISKIIQDQDTVRISGGKIKVEYCLNYSKNQGGKNYFGFAAGSVISDPLVYEKILGFDSVGTLRWFVYRSYRHYQQTFRNLTFMNRIKINTMEPFNLTDFRNLESILNQIDADSDPKSFKDQFLSTFNDLIPPILNNTINPPIFNPELPYTFPHKTKGNLTLPITNHLYSISLTENLGYNPTYLHQIDSQPPTPCNPVPIPHNDWQNYGDVYQSNLHCFYEMVVQYMQGRGWLDARLGVEWDSGEFLFRVGNLFDFVYGLYADVNPNQLVQGECKARKENLSFKYDKGSLFNGLILKISFICNAKTKDLKMNQIDILKFTVDIKYSIKFASTETSLDFQITKASILNLTFTQVGKYFVNNQDIALQKGNSILKQLINNKVFGTGFPKLKHKRPMARVTENYTVYYERPQSIQDRDQDQEKEKDWNGVLYEE